MSRKNRHVALFVLLGLIVLLVLGAGLIVKSRYAGGGDSTANVSPLIPIRSVSADDHVIGERGAPIRAVVYTDVECEFCADFHRSTSPRLFREYGDALLIVYRHHPLDHLHPNARRGAEAAECAAYAAGESGFWRYMDELFAITDTKRSLNSVDFAELAERIGINTEKFNACMDSGEAKERVQKDLLESSIAGLMITPSTVIEVGGRQRSVSGDSYSRIRAAIDSLRVQSSSSL